MHDAVANGFVNKFMWGLEQSGAKRPFAVTQKRGKILSIDNGDDIGSTYPEHPLKKIVKILFFALQTSIFHENFKFLILFKLDIQVDKNTAEAWDEDGDGVGSQG